MNPSGSHSTAAAKKSPSFWKGPPANYHTPGFWLQIISISVPRQPAIHCQPLFIHKEPSSSIVNPGIFLHSMILEIVGFPANGSPKIWNNHIRKILILKIYIYISLNAINKPCAGSLPHNRISIGMFHFIPCHPYIIIHP